jgi:predicted RNase H-like HicB family nuclease
MAGRERRLSYVVHQEGDGFVARCPEVNVASEGDTEPEAIGNLCEALELYFEDAAEQPASTT